MSRLIHPQHFPPLKEGPTSRLQRLIVEGYPPLSLNEVIDLAKGHWSAYAKEKKRRTEAVAWLAKSQGLKPVRKPPSLCIWYYQPNRKVEKDNLLVNDKWLIDGLVLAGVLPSDRWDDYVDLDHRFQIDQDRPRIAVELCEEVFCTKEGD
jgi:hypothetical protein